MTSLQALDHWLSDSENEQLPAQQEKSTHHQTSQNPLKNAIVVGRKTQGKHDNFIDYSYFSIE